MTAALFDKSLPSTYRQNFCDNFNSNSNIPCLLISFFSDRTLNSKRDFYPLERLLAISEVLRRVLAGPSAVNDQNFLSE